MTKFLCRAGASTLISVILIALLNSVALAQRITGGISGTVTDPQGAVVGGAKVTISNAQTGYRLDLVTNSNGLYTAPDLPPATYKVRIEQPGFAPFVATAQVLVGVITPVNAKLQVGTTATEVTVAGTAVTVDTTKPTVQGVISGRQIDNIPLNGRNFLQLASLEPGVQIVDGGSFDPTKNQMTGVSVGGRSGRVTRIQVDGVDITDETVGTTVANLSNESIQEFGISQSMLDPSTDITSSGAVNIITRSGTNDIHGSGFGFFRDARFAADQRLDKTSPTTAKPPFDRQNFGGRAGGPFIKDKLFWHVEYEQTNQDSQRFTIIPEFPQFSSAFAAPVDEKMAAGRADFNLTGSTRLFYRFMHNDNIGVTGFGGRDLSSFGNRNNTNIHVSGIDYASGRWTHQGRFSYLNFNNFVQDTNAQAGTPETLSPDGRPLLIRIASTITSVGPDLLAPQNTFQDNKQSKYDGSYTFGKHSLRFGAEYNKIDEFVFANFFGLAPRLFTSSFNAANRSFAAAGPFPGGAQNPLNYPVNRIYLGNNLGFFSEKPVMDFPHGGTTIHRLGFYLQDSAKVLRNLTLNFGLRYNWNSFIADNDLERTTLIGLFDPTQLGKPRRPNDNFAPQLGFAWDVAGDGRTVVRGGAGIFYETNIINNILFDRVLNIPPGLGNDQACGGFCTSGGPLVLDPGTGATLFDFTRDCSVGGGNCFNQPIGLVINDVYRALGPYQAASAALAANWPPPGVPPLFDAIRDGEGSLTDVHYKTPYGAQFNIGFQHEIKNGLVLSADYVHNRGARFNQTVDLNRIGAANTLDVATAQAAIEATFAGAGCAFPGYAARTSLGATAFATALQSAVDCMVAGGGGISDFADNGLGSGSALDGFAFRGMNPNFRGMGFIRPIGLSRFQALQVRLTGRLGSAPVFHNTTVNITYQLGRFNSTGLDQDFLSASAFNDRPTAFYGPAGVDRLHQVGISFVTELPLGFRLATATSFKTALATSMFLPEISGGADEIFFSDLDGDGRTADPVPGTNRGSYSREVNASNLNNVIGNYNSKFANKITPAGQALVDAGLFTADQLAALGAVATPLDPAPAGAVNNDSLINTDIRFSNRIRLSERMSLEPMVEIFNLFNVSNYEALSSTLDGSPGSVNGTTRNVNVVDSGLVRLGAGSGSFSPGTQRAFQFGVRFSF